jgi:hypothetical protein
MGRCFADKRSLRCRGSGGGLDVRRQPSVDADLKTAAGPVVGHWVTSGKVDPSAAKAGAAGADVLLCGWALPNAMAVLVAESASFGASAGAEEGSGVVRDEVR